MTRGVVMPITMMGMLAVKEMAQTPPTIASIVTRIIRAAGIVAMRVGT
jgi:hypothetical protein